MYEQLCMLLLCINQRKSSDKNWACAFIRGIYINFFVQSVKDNSNAALSDGNDQTIILRSKLATTRRGQRLVR